MRVIEYDRAGINSETKDFANPTWKQVEDAVHRLDKFRFPLVQFFLDIENLECAKPDFEIMGGISDFYMTGQLGGAMVKFFDPNSNGDLIEVDMHDEGISVPGWHVCHDVDAVLIELMYFSNTGEFSEEFRPAE